MKCAECSVDGAGKYSVRYTAGETEELALCNACRGEFEDGGFIGKIEAKSE